MIISNVSRGQIYYSVQDTSGEVNDGGSINASGYVEFEPRGKAPFRVSYASVSLASVPSSAIVTFWSSTGGGFSE